MDKLRLFLRERLGADAKISTGAAASWAYTFGWVIVFLVLLEAVTGTALAMFYAPTTTDAWASVAYVNDQAAGGWLVRGLHFHGASAMVIVCGCHLLQTLLRGSYTRPRELTWWLGIVLYALVLGWAVTGYVLRWDQAGYMANRVEIGIAAGTPGLGDQIRLQALGGNDYGNLTLTRFYALHALVMPAIFIAGIIGHVWIAKRVGTSSPRRSPRQRFQTSIVTAIVFAALFGYVVAVHGADLAAPADPTASFDARPLWYFRWLFMLRELAGSAEKIAAMAAPAIVGGLFVMLPLLDKDGKRPAVRYGAVGMLAIVIGLTFASLAGDSGKPELDKRVDAADKLSQKARRLAIENGVPSTGALDVYATPPMYRARSLFEQRCKGCHDAQSKDRKGPIIGPGHGNRAWIEGFLKNPKAPEYWGKTKLGASEDGMPKVDVSPEELANLVEALYAESGATDLDAKKLEAGRKSIKGCNDCHATDEAVAGPSAPNLNALDSRDYYTHFIGNPKSAIHMQSEERSEMPRFDKELSIADRDLIAQYLVWLRTATQADIDALGPL